MANFIPTITFAEDGEPKMVLLKPDASFYDLFVDVLAFLELYSSEQNVAYMIMASMLTSAAYDGAALTSEPDVARYMISASLAEYGASFGVLEDDVRIFEQEGLRFVIQDGLFIESNVKDLDLAEANEACNMIYGHGLDKPRFNEAMNAEGNKAFLDACTEIFMSGALET